MKYTVTIDNKTVTVNLNGYKGVAKCCDTDTFNLQTGIELALERARVAEANAKNAKTAKPMGIMELVKALEKALPKGQMVVVGNGKELSKAQREWLHSLSGCTNKGGYTAEDLDNAYDEGYADGENSVDDRYDEGYEDGYSDGYDEGCEDSVDEEDIVEAIRKVLGK